MEFDKYGCKVNNVHGVVVVKAQKEKINIYIQWQGLRGKCKCAKFLNEGALLSHEKLCHFNVASFNKWTWKKYHCTMCVKDALKENIHLSLSFGPK
jgi:hypothetical protein